MLQTSPAEVVEIPTMTSDWLSLLVAETRSHLPLPILHPANQGVEPVQSGNVVHLFDGMMIYSRCSWPRKQKGRAYLRSLVDSRVPRSRVPQARVAWRWFFLVHPGVLREIKVGDEDHVSWCLPRMESVINQSIDRLLIGYKADNEGGVVEE